MEMNDLLKLFVHCPRNSPLFGVAREAAEVLRTSRKVKVVRGRSSPCEHYREIYDRRLRRMKAINESVPGVEETVKMFSRCQGQLRGGYALADARTIHFWTDEAGELAGCVLSKPERRSGL